MPDNPPAYAIVFATQGVEAGVVRVARLHSEERISGRSVTVLDLEHFGEPLELRALVLAWAEVLAVEVERGEVVRRWSGYVTEVRERVMRDGEVQRFTVEIESSLHLASLSNDYRVHLEKTTTQIVTDTLTAAGLPTSAFELRLAAPEPARDVCTQWNERLDHFCSRLLEEDGIFTFVSQQDGRKLIFGDSDAAYEPILGNTEIPFLPGEGLLGDQRITGLAERLTLRPAKVTRRDHDFTKPSLEVTGEATSDAPFGREEYGYPARASTPAAAKRAAERQLAALVADSAQLHGRGVAPSLAAGHTFTLDGGPAPWAGTELVVVSVTHVFKADGAGRERLSTTFSALPKSTPFRPLPRTPRPVVRGPISAFVTGPAGEEIHCDEHGRVRVQFPWDRYGKSDDKSSWWVRVGQQHTSGSVAIPRVGWEVLVDFEDGDPDKPIIVGRLFNGVFTPPAALPAGKTVSAFKSFSSPGGAGQNEIRMDDGAGGEQIAVAAEKDLNLVVANNKEEKVTTNAVIGIGANQKLKVGASQTVKVGADSQINVGGSQTHSVGAARTKTVGGEEAVGVGGARSVSIGGSHTIMTPMSSEISTSGSLTETVGAVCVEAAGLGVSLAVAGSASITVGGAKIEAVAAGKNDMTIGARASTVGGAHLSLTGKDVTTETSGAKATTVGGAWIASAGGKVSFTSAAALTINVGGAVAMTGGSLVLSVGGTSITLSGGSVVLKAADIALTATGPHMEVAGVVASK